MEVIKENSFRELRIWQKGFDLLDVVYKVTKGYPSEEKFALVSDTRRSANSVIANIAEAHGRYFYSDKVRVLYIARGEAEEIRSHLSVALSQGYITEQIFNNLDQEYNGLSIGINSYINYLINQNKADKSILK
jgi:four helix bundle protein